MNELLIFPYNLRMSCMAKIYQANDYIQLQHCDEKRFQTLACVHYTIFSVVKLDLFIQALLLDHILALAENYAYAYRASYYIII